MSVNNIATIKRITADDLSTLLLSSKAPQVAVIDVRDDDHVGGHIHGSTHVPSSTLDHQVPEIVRKMADKEVVVFHCALSQQRGPAAALRYMHERQRKAKKGEMEGIATAVEETGPAKTASDDKPGEQEIYVLDKGFEGWQQKYGRDKRLTASYTPDFWEE
ncbi:MAG: hypothetical protein Q9163_004553 [Psora crenata]